MVQRQQQKQPPTHLLNTRSLEIWNASDVEDQKEPEDGDLQYAILSHCWGKSETSFQRYQSNNADTTPGNQKIRGCCAQAVLDGYDWVWIDTCCIDKSSSAEMSEAINSMYIWYQNAAVCYAYLFDTQAGDSKLLRKSNWFKRGWTLQELLAPKEVRFFDEDWNPLGNKQELASLISEITRIPSALLEGDAVLRSWSVAQRMSWASERNTKRREDKAYCLLGLFDVNMPLLYGEGQKAFVRLQEEIVRQSDDHSIFAWSLDETRLSGLLAQDPVSFKNCGNIEPYPRLRGAEPFQMTNRGLTIKLSVTPWTADTYLSWLDCGVRGRTWRLGIFLRRLADDDQYARVIVDGESLIIDEESIADDKDRVQKEISLRVPHAVNLQWERDSLRPDAYGFQFVNVRYFELDFCENAKYWVRGQWCDEQRLACIPQGLCGTAVVVYHLSAHFTGIKSVTLGFDFEFNPVCFVEDDPQTDGIVETPDIPALSGVNDRCLREHDWYAIHEFKAYRREDHNGVWALKGHRLSGLGVILLQSLTITRWKKFRINIVPKTIAGRRVWTCSLSTRKPDMRASDVMVQKSDTNMGELEAASTH